MIVNALFICGIIFWNIYIFTGVMLMSDRRLKTTRVNTFWRWTKWPALGALFFWPVWIVSNFGPLNALDYLALIVGAFIWYFCRNAGDDDPMDKLTKRARGVVRVLYRRLVVVPTAVPA